ncbi:MAG: PBECR2 nuclease fold domain-containing protein, partial [Bdellovibrionales bacterium]
MKNSKSRAKKKNSPKDVELIVIDEKNGLIFEDEKALHGYFDKAINILDDQYLKLRQQDDFSDKAQIKLEKHLEETLDTPDQIWRDEGVVSEFPLHIYMKEIRVKSQEFTYISICYVTEEERIPTFVLTHFPTRNAKLIESYRKGELVYDKVFEKVVEGALEGDSLLEADPLATGLYLSMLKVRSEQDIPQKDFKNFSEMRESTIEDADEIWRKSDLN